MAKDDEDVLSKINRLFYENVSNPVVGTAVDSTVGVMDLLQMLGKSGLNKAGVETEPYAPAAPRLKQAMGVSKYDPYAPAAIAANLVGGAPKALGRALTDNDIVNAGLWLGREGKSFAASEGGQRLAEEIFPDNDFAGILGAVAGGTSYNTIDNLFDTSGVVTSNIVKPSGGVFPPTDIDAIWDNRNTYVPFNERSYFDSWLSNYASRLDEAGLSKEDALAEMEKARRFFTKSYGTASDPLKEGILSGKVATAPEDFKDYLLTAAKASPVPFTSNYGDIEASQALADFTKRYDSLTGMGIKVNPEGDKMQKIIKELFPETGTPSSWDTQAAFRSELTNALTNPQTPESLVNIPTIGYSAPGSSQFSNVLSNALKGGDETITRAINYGEPIYDLHPELSALNPNQIAQYINEIPENKRRAMPFHEIAGQTSRSAQSGQDFDKLVKRAAEGKPIPLTMLNQGIKPVPTETGNWVQITNPDYTKLESAFMSHSVKGYADNPTYGVGSKGPKAILDGTARVFSLRDAEGKPFVTVEAEYTSPTEGSPQKLSRITQVKGPSNTRPDPSLDAPILSLFNSIGAKDLSQNSRALPVENYRGGDKVDWGKRYFESDSIPKLAKGGPVTLPPDYSKGRRRLI